MNTKHSPGTITLIGSGEMSPSMSKVHRAIMSRIVGPVRAAFLDTPAGFELNADQISARAVRYFEHHLNVDLAVASFKAAATATPSEVDSALRQLLRSNYIFAGPGSPTYAVRNWRGTVILEAIARCLAAGSHLVLASAAAIAVGRYVLPVYEIYKVGEEPHWVEGLDLTGQYGLELAIVPHWNNTEGGTHDTRHCFVGESRMRLLEKNLPDSATILGIDEYTACTLDLSCAQCQVIGAGQVTIRRGGRETTRPAGATFSLDQLRRSNLPGRLTQPEPVTAYEWPDFPEPDVMEDDAADIAPFVDLLVWVRTQLRAARQWELADEIRQQLSKLGIVLEDDRTGTTWRTKEPNRDSLGE